MKFIADVNVEKSIVDCLRDMGCDVKWIPEYNPAISDSQLLKTANKEKRILITNDKDFGELIFRQNQITTGVILFRIRGQKPSLKIHHIKSLVQQFGDKLLHHFIVVTNSNIRFIKIEVPHERKTTLKKNRS